MRKSPQSLTLVLVIVRQLECGVLRRTPVAGGLKMIAHAGNGGWYVGIGNHGTLSRSLRGGAWAFPVGS